MCPPHVDLSVSAGVGSLSFSHHLSRLELLSHFCFILLPPVHCPYVELHYSSDGLDVACRSRLFLHFFVLLDEISLVPLPAPRLHHPSRIALSHGASYLRVSLFLLRSLLHLFRHLPMVLPSSLRSLPSSRSLASSPLPPFDARYRHASSILVLADPALQPIAEAVLPPSERPRLSSRRPDPLFRQTRALRRRSVPSPIELLSLDGCDRDDAGDRIRLHRTTRRRSHHPLSERKETAKSGCDSLVWKRLLAECRRCVADAGGITVRKSFLHGHVRSLGCVCRRGNRTRSQ